ncbi:hypothetical protein [Demequina mangrovi]|uniref:Uncharacterized protein n=1 Tax=Demequina mangrovi TaxID=1043493 RepID=A0A1H6X202_9MICO|nr:hypothetical protein [Demequina mangrovi]SEJ23193.1 hypothetical protein SAMN05421637_1251 [Demequina mangrovi]
MAGIPGGNALHALVLAVLEHGMRSLPKPEGLPVSLAQETGTGERTMTTFTGVGLEAAVKAARTKAGTSTAERVAIVWDGSLRGPEGDETAIMVLAQERGQPTTLVFAQRYSAKGSQIETIGGPGFVGDRKPLLG